MRQMAILGVAALSAVVLVGIGCSSDDNKTSGTGGATAAQGGASSTGGNSSPSSGGTTSTAAGGAPTTGGTTSTTVANVGGASMIAGENIINDECEVGGGEAVMGVVGGFYIFGDQTAEHPNGQSCTVPPQGTKPCEGADGGTRTGVCLSGTTIKDSTYAAWGCGIGLSLNSSDEEDTSDAGTEIKHPYSGPATCFRFTFTGTTGGLALRVGYTQYADTSIRSQSVAPYKPVQFSNGWTGEVCFDDVVCPNWESAPGQGCPAEMVATPSSSYDIQITVPGGSGVNNYDFCLTSVVPLKPQAH